MIRFGTRSPKPMSIESKVTKLNIHASQIDEREPRTEFDIENFAPYLLATLYHHVRGVLDNALSEFGTLTHWRILNRLSHGESRRLNDIAVLTGIPQSTVSRAIMRMEEADLVHHTKKPCDGRISDIRITDKGLRAYSIAIERMDAALEFEMSALSKDERNSWIGLMRKLVHKIEIKD